jgi:16S rRNA (adenine1518-N6/adenine1519-N6)-dimethyltransferase
MSKNWKKYGQHFLKDKNIVKKEIEQADIKSTDTVLEIGPGTGILTLELAKIAKQVIAIEIDSLLIEYLQDVCPKNVLLINNDALKIDFSSIPIFTKIVSNLPYQISSPITFKFLNYDFIKALLIYQKEFAERMIATPKTNNYGRLSVNIYYKAKCTMIQTISKHCFSPEPKIDSAMIELIPRSHPPFHVDNEEFFFDFTKKVFSYRRKKIKTILKKWYQIKNLDIPFAEQRIEELTPEEIGILSNIIYKKTI